MAAPKKEFIGPVGGTTIGQGLKYCTIRCRRGGNRRNKCGTGELWCESQSNRSARFHSAQDAHPTYPRCPRFDSSESRRQGWSGRRRQYCKADLLGGRWLTMSGLDSLGPRGLGMRMLKPRGWSLGTGFQPFGSTRTPNHFEDRYGIILSRRPRNVRTRYS